MTEKEYRANPAISRSELWRIRESPEKFKWYQEHPEPATPALIFGTAVHKLLLEPDTFNQEFAVAPDFDRRTKDGREAYNAFLSDSFGKTVISLADYEKAQEMVKKALESPFAKKLLDGEREKAFFWTDELTGEKCKCRVDCITYVKGQPIIVDYKTTTDARIYIREAGIFRDGPFVKEAVKYGYFFQASMYCEGIEKASGKKPAFVFIAQEKNPPYSVNIMQVNLNDPRTKIYGYDIFRELIGIYHECKTTGNWFGYLGAHNIINNLALPSWAAKELEQ